MRRETCESAKRTTNQENTAECSQVWPEFRNVLQYVHYFDLNNYLHLLSTTVHCLSLENQRNVIFVV